MKLFTHSRLFGILIVAASLPMDPGVALAASSVAASLEPAAPAGSLEARLQRITHCSSRHDYGSTCNHEICYIGGFYEGRANVTYIK